MLRNTLSSCRRHLRCPRGKRGISVRRLLAWTLVETLESSPSFSSHRLFSLHNTGNKFMTWMNTRHPQETMDRPDSKASEIAGNVEHHCSHEKLDTSGKEKGLSNSCGKSVDANIILKKDVHILNQEICSPEAETLPEMGNKYQNYDHVSANDCTNGDNADNSEPRSSTFSTSRNSVAEVEMYQKESFAEGTSGETSSIQSNPRDGEVSIHSLEGIDSTQHVSVKSDVTSETILLLNRESNELDVGITKGKWPNAGEVGFKSIIHATFHDTQLKTESSSSNSTHVTFPVSSSNESYQDTSVEAKSCKLSSSGMHSFICKGVKFSMEEPVADSVVLGMAAQITQKAVDNVRARNSKKVMGMIADQNSMIVEKVDIAKSGLLKKKNAEVLSQHKEELSYELDDALEVAWKVAREVEQKVGIYKEASGSSSSVEERNGETVRLSSVDSADPNKNNCSTETGLGVKLYNEQDNFDSFCSNEEVLHSETPMKNKHFLVVKGSSQEMDTGIHEANDSPHGQESSELNTKTEIVAAIDQTSLPGRFDLNEDIQPNEVEHPKQVFDEAVPYCNVINVSMPIHVVAKSGVPMCLPMTPLKFEGELGWRGSAATSAFRPASLSRSLNRYRASSIDDNNCSSRHSRGFTGIDLNVAATGDDSALESLHRESVATPSGYPFEESSLEVSSKRAEILNFDLNCLSQIDDNCPQSSPPVSLSRHSAVDFDLNDNPSIGDTCNDAQWPGQSSQLLRNKALDDPSVSFAGDSGKPDFNSLRPLNWADSNSIQGFSLGHTRPFLVAAPNLLPSIEQMQRVVPFQPKLPYTPQALPPYIYPYNNGFSIGPTSILSSGINSSGVLPYMTDPHGTTVIPQILGPGTLSAFPGASHLMEVVGGSSCSGIANIRSSFDVNGGINSSENVSRGANATQFLFPIKKPSTEEQRKSQVALFATPMKRKEPEGGWDSNQLGFRQVTSWR
ncbi:hypothetical protein F0562_002971 [Nyssa sinensis]|uniref:Uncharacterized protein n=1 Tax=Nyssa sinensis TaxID=561372 RepID=A0A5J5BW50_9ASTE|nr:hypothetical protein F0562_002971 [Nyssa sinensis]